LTNSAYPYKMKKNPTSYRKNTTAPLKEVFDELLEAYHLKGKYSEKSLIEDWEPLMGKTVASRTTSLTIQKKVLYAKISSGPLKKEMMMNKSKVMQIITDKFGPDVIKDIVFL